MAHFINAEIPPTSTDYSILINPLFWLEVLLDQPGAQSILQEWFIHDPTI